MQCHLLSNDGLVTEGFVLRLLMLNNKTNHSLILALQGLQDDFMKITKIDHFGPRLLQQGTGFLVAAPPSKSIEE